jgi:hypothetical protein
VRGGTVDAAQRRQVLRQEVAGFAAGAEIDEVEHVAGAGAEPVVEADRADGRRGVRRLQDGGERGVSCEGNSRAESS